MDNSALRRTVKNWAGPDAYMRILAFARVYLDNFDHVQGTWFSEGKGAAYEALQYGADDLGGINMEENVHRATGWINKIDHAGIVKIIREAGYTPAQRNPLYEILRTYEDPSEEIYVPEAQRVKEQDQVLVEAR